jgi:outer membrane protein assembly factor BamA
MHQRFLPVLAGLIFLLSPVNKIILSAQDTALPDSISPADSVWIDRIEISKNWITWDLIIKNELLFGEGEWVRYGEIDTSMNKVWNIGNFADVKYTIDQGPEGNTMNIIALDAVKFYPLFTIDHSSENDYNYRLGAGDDNFLGSNTKLKIAWEKNPQGVKWDFSIGLPRQLLYKNMTTRLGFAKGNETKVFLDRVVNEVDGDKVATYNTLMLAPYNKTEFYAEIGNPWHLDYRYRFSPNLSLRYNIHEINDSLLSQDDLDLGVNVPYDQYNFLNITVSESIGTVDKKRHRKNGYMAMVSYGLNLGFRGTSNFHTFNAEGEYHRSFNKLFQASFWARTGYTTADNQYRFIKGSSDVLGLRTGEIFGKSYYSAYAGAHFTWLNTKWIALENAYFVNFGNGSDDLTTAYFGTPKAAVGSFLEITFPIAPIAVFRFSFMYAGPGSEWFKFNIK